MNGLSLCFRHSTSALLLIVLAYPDNWSSIKPETCPATLAKMCCANASACRCGADCCSAQKSPARPLPFEKQKATGIRKVKQDDQDKWGRNALEWTLKICLSTSYRQASRVLLEERTFSLVAKHVRLQI
jgi:hypothetical protein